MCELLLLILFNISISNFVYSTIVTLLIMSTKFSKFLNIINILNVVYTNAFRATNEIFCHRVSTRIVFYNNFYVHFCICMYFPFTCVSELLVIYVRLCICSCVVCVCWGLAFTMKVLAVARIWVSTNFDYKDYNSCESSHIF